MPQRRERPPTAAELEVLGEMTEPGATRRSAAHVLGITESAANGRLRSLYRRLGVNSAGQALAATPPLSVRAGLIG